jgi:hypothetical protein
VRAKLITLAIIAAVVVVTLVITGVSVASWWDGP